MKRSLAALCLTALCAAPAQAEVRLTLPDDLVLLGSAQGHAQGQSVTLPDGVNQLLLQYDGVEESRSSSESDRHYRSRPQVLRFEASNTSLQLTGLPDERGDKARFAEHPVLTLHDGAGQPVNLVQDELAVSGLQIGVDWSGKLADYNRGTGKAAWAAAGVVSATAPADTLEAELQRLFLGADPALKRRFIGWAANQL
ncbi:DUF2057 family protein [Aeromonas schubertii]|uniref:DUF2057 family protein n=1 Tax=Aeromonas TaxID=642 RepID=UPI0010A92C98|nr:DUF2057 family protein [Aeromonas schubertii]QCG47349.1 DUF2057 domain-containing protein [Aeromonas schubertii]